MTRKLNNCGVGSSASISVAVLASRRDGPGSAALETQGHASDHKVLALLASIYCNGSYSILFVVHVLCI